MKAMILAAGKGTRLMPLTENRPKALVEVGNIPMVEYAISNLKKAGVTEIILNVHHFANQIKDYFRDYHSSDLKFSVSDETDLLLDTGGGLKKASWFFNDNAPFFLYAVDIVTGLDLKAMLKHHQANKNQITLAVSKRETSRTLIIGCEGELLGWRNNKTGQERVLSNKMENIEEFGFSGVHIVSPEVFKHFPKDDVFSIIGFYLDLASKVKIGSFLHDASEWLEFGRFENFSNKEMISKAEKIFSTYA